MAEINQIFNINEPKKILEVDSALIKTDNTLLKFSEDVLKLTEVLKENNISFNKLQKVQKEAKNTSADLDKVGKQLVTSEEKLSQIEDKRTKIIIKNRIEAQKSTKEIQLKIKAQQAERGSTEQLSAVNAILEKRLKSVNQTTVDGKQKADLLRSAIDKNNIKIKEQSSALTKQKINIGNYRNSLEGMTVKIKDLTEKQKKLDLSTKSGKKEFKELTREIDKTKGSIKSYSKSNNEAANSGGLKGALNGLLAGFKSLAANPIVLIIAGVVLALKELKGAFESSDKGRGVLAKGMGALKGIGQVIFNLFSKLAEILIKAFEDPQKAVTDLWELIKANLINRVTAIPDLFVAIFDTIGNTFKLLGSKIKLALADVPILGKKIDVKKATQDVEDSLNGIKDSAKNAGTALIQLNTGLDKIQQQNIGGFIANEFKESAVLIQKSIDLEIRQLRLREAQIANITKEAILEKDIAILRLNASDQTVSAIKRLEDVNIMESKINEKIDEQIKLKQEEADVIRLRNSLGKNTLDDTEKEKQLQADVINLEKSRSTEMRTLNRLRQRSLDQIADTKINDALGEETELLKGLNTQLINNEITVSEFKEKKLKLEQQSLQFQVDSYNKILSEDELTESKRVMFTKQRIVLEKKLATKQAKDILDTTKLLIDSEIQEKQRQYEQELLIINSTVTNEKNKRERIFELTKKYIAYDISEAQKLLDNTNLAANIRIELSNKLKDLELENNQLVADDDKKKHAEKIARQERLIDETINIVNKLFEFSMAKTDAELKALEDKNKNGLISDEEYAKQKSKLELKKAKQERASALFSIAVDTAKGISKAVSESPLTFGLPWSAFALATGLIQAATVLTKPLPKALAKGTKDAPREFIAGEEGRELIATKSGRLIIADKPTYFEGNNFKGATVFSNPETERIISQTEHSGFGNKSMSDERILQGLIEVKNAIKNKSSWILDNEYRVIGKQQNNHREIYINRLNRES